jgi:prolyl-tRNA editing enzyme YbaK/EbsC (Cys-tRNA(Pro) deacylase)
MMCDDRGLQGMPLPAHTYLDQLGILYERRTFPATTEKGAASVARTLGFREHQMVKTLIFETDRGERVLVMLGGDQSAISGHLKKALGSRNIRMASPEVVKATTGYEIGSIPPLVPLRKQPSDLAYWLTQPYQVRLAALEEIRREYNHWRYGAEPRLARVYTIVKR